MNRLQRLAASALGLALVIAAPPVQAGGDPGLPQPLAPFEATYRITDGSSRLGRAEFGLERVDEGWRYYSRVKPEGLYALLLGEARDTAVLEAHGDTLRPLRFTHDEDGDDEDIRIEFDWAAGQARVIDQDGERTVALAPGMHDQFSAMLAVMQAFAAGRDRLQLPSIDDEGEAEPLTFERTASTSMETPLETFDTVHVRRVRSNSKRETESWLAPAAGWIPVRIDQRRKGELVARMELIGLNGRTAERLEESPR